MGLPYTQKIQTHNSHKHNITPPLQTLQTLKTLVQTSYPLPICTTHTTAAQTRHTSNTSPVPTGFVKPKPNPLIHSPPSPPTTRRAKHIHISHTPPTTLIPRTTIIHSMSAALDTIPELRVPLTCPALTTTTLLPSPTPPLPSTSHPHTLSAYTHATQTTVDASQSQQPPHPHRLPRQPHRQTKADHMTTNTPQGHRPSSTSERNLIILQVYINGTKTNSRSSNCLSTTHVQITSQFRKPNSPLKPTYQGT